MKRRNFIRNLGLGSSSLFLSQKIKAGTVNSDQNNLVYSYGNPSSVDEAMTKDGEWIVRIEYTCNEGQRFTEAKGSISVKDAIKVRSKNYFFEDAEDQFHSDSLEYHNIVEKEHKDIIVLWLKEASASTTITITVNDINFEFSLQELIDNKEAVKAIDRLKLKANFLLDKEIGMIKPEDAGIKDTGNEYCFAVMADPQGGDASGEDELRTRMRIHNAFIEESVALVNRLQVNPAFTMVVGDVTDAWGYKRDFIEMNKFLSKIKTPVLYEIGNHETRLRMNFSPGYNMEGFNNFLAAQKNINGIDKLLYTFNLGKWHFIVWPDPLRDGFWENHPHYFDWLERDLEKHKDRPVMLFQHVPAHPVGITPLINYAESVYVKRTLLTILAKHGNVKYILSGHVHIPVKSSFKTAVTYKGIKMINLPAAGYRPRAFGEEDYYGGPAQGVALVDIDGDNAEITYKTVTEEEYVYPQDIKPFDEKKHALWLNYKWEIPADQQFRNGDFSAGSDNWIQRYFYEEDNDPANICEVRDTDNGRALYMFTKCRGYMKPGQDRWPQDINRVCQAVACESGKRPFIKFNYKLDGKNCDLNGFSGAYVWIEGYGGSMKRLNLMYSAGKIWCNIGGKMTYFRLVPPIMLALNEEPGQWHEATLNIADDFDKYNKANNQFTNLNIDRLIVNLGLWNINDGDPQPFGIFFKQFNIDYNLGQSSNVNGSQVAQKDNDNDVWWRGKYVKSTHVAGEHRYVIGTNVNYKNKE